MENQQKQQPDLAAGQVKKAKGKRGFMIPGLVIGLAIACAIIWLMFADASTSRASTPSEIAAQEEFQQKIDAARKETEQIRGAAEQK